MTSETNRFRKIVVIGGVAGGATFAARFRRNDENASITIIEKGPYISFANCGLPYHVGGTIAEREMLLMHTPQSFKERYYIDVLVRHEATSVDSSTKKITALNLDSGETKTFDYDVLLLSPGAEAFKPPIPGVDKPNVFTLQTIPQMDAIIDWIKKNEPTHAAVVGAGFIGLEIAENLKERGLEITVVEMMNQVMPPVDPEIAEVIHGHLTLQGIELRLGARITGIVESGDKTCLCMDNEEKINTDMVILAVGVRPRVKLAESAGLELGRRGGIIVDEHMRTSDPDIYAIGDAVEVAHPILGEKVLLPLAGPANRQARVAADNASGLREDKYPGTLGTSICKIFDLAVALTGASEKLLKRAEIPYRKVIIHPASHAGYYPGAHPMTMKLLFAPGSGDILGAQVVGAEGADKQIDVLSTAITGHLTVFDLQSLELAYAPPFGSAKSPANYAGFVAANILEGYMKPAYVEEVPEFDEAKHVLLDVRTPEEFLAGTIPGAVNVPLKSLRDRLNEMPVDKEIIIFCHSGMRGHLAYRLLTQHGLNCRNLIGGYKSWTLVYKKTKPLPPIPYTCTPFCGTPENEPKRKTGKETDDTAEQAGEVELDVCGLQCPGPLMKMREKMDALHAGARLKVIATDPGFVADARSWCEATGNHCVDVKAEAGKIVAIIEKTDKARPAAGEDSATPPAQKSAGKELTLVVFSCDLDRAIAAFVIANGARAMGMDVTMFFTFWGLNVLRKEAGAKTVNKSLLESMFGMMMPRGAEHLKLSKLNMLGLGTAMMKNTMKGKRITGLPDLLKSAGKNGVRMVACTMSMEVMGIKKEELVDGVEEGGVAAYLGAAEKSRINLFV